MTRADALNLRVADYVVHAASAVPWRPIRVSEVWHNEKRTIVLVRLASIDATAWLDATGYDLPPAYKVWDQRAAAWVAPAERAESIDKRPAPSSSL